VQSQHLDALHLVCHDLACRVGTPHGQPSVHHRESAVVNPYRWLDAIGRPMHDNT
jgi:hypothetical protein